ncbi:MAG: peptidoglycan-binding protein [Planctomycetes bacterium]|nr:peptidoglycan-binding protein [Planctomycetota bacterium]
MDLLFKQYAVPWITNPAIEGDFSNDASDRGGPTRFGISLRYLRNVPDHDGNGFLDGDIDEDGDVDIDDIRALKPGDAIERYHKDFWLTGKCNEMPPGVGLCLFDGLVQHRPKTAKMLLQRALRVSADGYIGPITIAAAQNVTSISIFDDFLPNYLSYRSQFYHDLVLLDSSQAKYIRGWFVRMFLLQNYIFRYAD